MTSWLGLLISSCGVIIGAVIGGVSTIATQRVIHSGVSQRELEARRHEDAIRQREVERETLLALQDALMGLHLLFVQLISNVAIDSESPNEFDFINQVSRVYKLCARTLGHEASSVVRIYVSRTVDIVRASEGLDALDSTLELYSDAQASLGEAWRGTWSY